MKIELRKLATSGCMLFFGFSLYAQPIIQPKYRDTSRVDKKESEDISYELKHKKGRWFKKMNQPNVRYFSIKRSFVRYFGKHRWEGSRTRELGESWIKTKKLFKLLF